MQVGHNADDKCVLIRFGDNVVGCDLATARRLAEALYAAIGQIEGTNYMVVRCGLPEAMSRNSMHSRRKDKKHDED